MLANHAGGKQTPGIMGISISYIFHKDFLKGDGGIRNVVWTDSELYEKIRKAFPAGQRTATERDVTDVEGLKQFLKKRPGIEEA
ncbi:MAG: hypothetical protein AB1798_01085 [Spirochaetota bacterium]